MYEVQSAWLIGCILKKYRRRNTGNRPKKNPCRVNAMTKSLHMPPKASVLLFVAVTAILHAQNSSEERAAWNKPVKPFRIIGNIYYVGVSSVSSFLIKTPQGATGQVMQQTIGVDQDGKGLFDLRFTFQDSDPSEFASINPQNSTALSLYDMADATDSFGFNGGLTYRPGNGLFYAIINDSSANSSLISFSLGGGGAFTNLQSIAMGSSGGSGLFRRWAAAGYQRIGAINTDRVHD